MYPFHKTIHTNQYQDLFVHPVTNYILSLITSSATAVAATLGRLGGGAFAVTLSLPVILHTLELHVRSEAPVKRRRWSHPGQLSALKGTDSQQRGRAGGSPLELLSVMGGYCTLS